MIDVQAVDKKNPFIGYFTHQRTETTSTKLVSVDSIKNIHTIRNCKSSGKFDAFGRSDTVCHSRFETCDEISSKTGKIIISPYDNYNVICGQASIAFELHKQVPDLDAILVPTSGGGLISGISLATKFMNPKCKVIAVEPKGKNLEPCLKAKERLWSNPPQFVDTIAEGIKTQQVLNFDHNMILKIKAKFKFLDGPFDLPNCV